MKKLILLLVLFYSQNLFAVQQTVSLELIGMYCAMCPVTIRTALEMSDGVENVKVSRGPDKAIVIYDDEATSPDELVKVVVDSGYNAIIMSAP
ncbi:MAG: mercuric transport protein periplasmic component [Thiotrichaceae bacterium]|nr:MAG: mercuric transport protein periplasmic component [Thiotrichaceae bacterium]